MVPASLVVVPPLLEPELVVPSDDVVPLDDAVAPEDEPEEDVEPEDAERTS